MLKKLHTTLLLLITVSFCLSSHSNAQTYGNEWINYNQSYYSFKIVEDGVYRIDFSTLQNAGVPVSSISSENFQIFAREHEIPLHIVDGNDSSFDSGDYLLFYARGNDGWLDSTLYKDPTTIGSPAISLYNDTIQYFLTWNSSTTNSRYIQETDVDFASYTPSNFIWGHTEQPFTVAYHEGEIVSDVSSSFYVPGEGWGRQKINGVPNGHTSSFIIPTHYLYSGVDAPDAKFNGLSVSNSDADATNFENHHLRWRIGNGSYTIKDTSFIGYQQIIAKENIPVSALSSGNTPIFFDIVDDLGAETDFQSISYYSLIYPRNPTFGNANNYSFTVPNNALESKIRLDVTNVGYNIPLVFVHGETPRMVPFVLNSGFYSMLIPNNPSGEDQEVIYTDSSLVIDVTSLSPVNGNGTFTDFTSISGGIERALLMIYHPSTPSAAQNYDAYRSSIAGGGYNTILANVDELYQQFGGGIEKHINGIRRYSHFIYNNSSEKPVGLYLMGKGIRESTLSSFTSDGPGTRFDPARFQASLIPSYGHPSSDVAITAGLEGTEEWTPLIPTGRISTRTDAELQGYLNKVIDYELQQNQNDIYDSPTKDWQKQILHFSGGSNAGQQTLFKGYMDDMQTTIQDSLFGGNVTSIYKTSSDPLDPTILSSVTDRIQEGVSIMNYFGHSSSTNSGFEINLDEPENWNNQGKYPLMLVNSCYNGNIFQLSNSKSEDFVQTDGYGAIAYIASVHIGFAQTLNSYSQELYRQFSYDSYGQTFGEQMQQTISLVENPSNLYLETTCLQMALNGDPMLRLNWHANPEIEITEEGVSFSPEDIDLTVDSIEMHIEMTNLGQSVTSPFFLTVERDFPLSTTDSIYTFTIDHLDYKDTFSFKLPVQPNIGVGINNFSVSVDLPSQITEQYDEIGNNQITKTLFLDVDGILPVIPYNYAVVPNDSVTVKASTINPIAEQNTYRFEIDTTDTYDSPQHRFAIVNGLGGVKEVAPDQWMSASSGISSPLVCTDSTVYFWRVAIDDPNPSWREYSFQHIVGKEGWGQDHFFQFKNNSFTGILYDRPTRTRIFGTNSRLIQVDAKADLADWAENAWYIDGDLQDYGIGTLAPKFHVGVIDPTSLVAWETNYNNTNPGFSFGNDNDITSYGLPRPMKYFTFRQDDPAQLAAFQDMITNHVPDGHYLAIYSPMTMRHDLINSIDSAGVFGLFTALGSDSIHGGRPNRTMAFFCEKGNPASVVEEYAAIDGGDASVEALATGFDFSGVEGSPLIGPAAQWNNVYWKQDPEEVGSEDSTSLTINAYNISGALQLSIDTLFTSNDSILNLNSIIDANLYPYIQLQAYYSDTTTFTPAQIDRWHVLYDPLPEAAIDGTEAYTWSLSSDTLFEGQSVDFAVDVKNIFTRDMDSLLISYWIEDANQVKHPIPYERQDSLRVGETLRDTITINTTGLGGINSLWMEVNPYVNGSYYITDQPEQEHFNNILQVPFFVSSDDVNPILDVTFNGRRILNGDIIDPNSEILITLKDDNEHLIMDDISDTTLFGVYLTYPSGEQVRIPFVDNLGNTVMQWVPADQQSKRFKIIWPTELVDDGTYSLFVQGADRSGNLSGDIEYRVSFDIIHESSITHMMNYPNPFSTSTQFVFTLTGSEVPDDIIIQIMTVTGKIVREITESEIGAIHIGRNITDFSWDGTDEFGDPLANGVYLYRVKALINGEDIKHRNSGADSYFKKEFGKMYILR